MSENLGKSKHRRFKNSWSEYTVVGTLKINGTKRIIFRKISSPKKFWINPETLKEIFIN
jgi:hypothetical protein